MLALAKVAFDKLPQFTEKGYFTVDALVDSKVVSELAFHVNELARTLHAPQTLHKGVRNDKGDVVFMNRLDAQVDFIYDFHRLPQMLAFAETLIGKKVVPLSTEYFGKPPGSSRPTPPHQDQTFYNEHFDNELAVAVWIALDDVTPESGALQYVPQPLRGASLLPHVAYVGAELEAQLEDASRPPEAAYETAPVPKGGAAVHHAFVVHRSLPNTAGKPRRAIVFNYRGSEYRQQLALAQQSDAADTDGSATGCGTPLRVKDGLITLDDQ